MDEFELDIDAVLTADADERFNVDWTRCEDLQAGGGDQPQSCA